MERTNDDHERGQVLAQDNLGNADRGGEQQLIRARFFSSLKVLMVRRGSIRSRMMLMLWKRGV
jgi:hypothetical protein